MARFLGLGLLFRAVDHANVPVEGARLGECSLTDAASVATLDSVLPKVNNHAFFCQENAIALPLHAFEEGAGLTRDWVCPL